MACKNGTEHLWEKQWDKSHKRYWWLCLKCGKIRGRTFMS